MEQKVGAGYLTIKNEAATSDRLVSASADIAARTEIHEMNMDGGVMKMRQVPDGLATPADGTVALAPNGYHLMFIDFRQPLKDGGTFQATLNFEKAGKISVTFDVKGSGAAGPDAAEHQHHWTSGKLNSQRRATSSRVSDMAARWRTPISQLRICSPYAGL